MLKSALQQPNNGKSGQVRVGDFLSINLLMSVCVVEHHSVVQFFYPRICWLCVLEIINILGDSVYVLFLGK